MKINRTEEKVLSELAKLCQQPGYIHSLAYLCFRDNVIIYEDKLEISDLSKIYSTNCLIRTEINTLLGLLIKKEINWNLPLPKVMQTYIDKTEKLLKELHLCVSGDMFSVVKKEQIKSSLNPFEYGKALRESIFYGSEPAYDFQYLDLAVTKYKADASWLIANQGFTIDLVSCVAKAIKTIQTEHFSTMREYMMRTPAEEWTYVDFFAFSIDEVSLITGISYEVVAKILCAFELPLSERNERFKALNDFNVITATPLIRMPDGRFLSLQFYSLAEAIYESPFFWMAQDKQYLQTLTENRGNFTENFSAERLRLVFGKKNVYQNVDIFESKAKKISDIDVLVMWGNRVIIVQAKSKRLTMEARKGNDLVIQDDFKKAVQAAYDQGIACARCLADENYRLVASDGNTVVLPHDVKEIYIFCIVSDNYPALSFQAQQFLKTENIDRVQTPLVMDIFALDVMSEMLRSPLKFLSYVNRRVNYGNRLLASQELTILGYHLTKNLWVDDDIAIMHLDDDFSAELDRAMIVRRGGGDGDDTPDGVLTRLDKTTIGQIVKEIEARPDPQTIDLGFLLLELSESAVRELSKIIDILAAKVRKDRKLHDITFATKQGAGITFHCNDEPFQIAADRLNNHCINRKYKEKAEKWFGICMSSDGPSIRFGVTLIYPWAQDSELDKKTNNMQLPGSSTQQILDTLNKGHIRSTKIGRNDPCPCGSGRKYKKCCLN